jgi:hypothetical protein
VKRKYLFLRLDSEGATTKFSDDLDEFYDFCHYSSLSDWTEHKKIIRKCFREDGKYEFVGNSISYYIFTDVEWDYSKLNELSVKNLK